MPLRALAEHLQASRELLVERWLASVLDAAHRAPAARGLTAVQLRDHIPLLLAQIEQAIAGQPVPQVEEDAREHGTQRWGHGFAIDEVIWELSALRLLLLEEVEGYARAHADLPGAAVVEASRRLIEVIDLAARASAAQFMRDVTVQFEANYQQLQAANEELQVANQQLAVAGAEKDRFLAMLAHELRNPLSPILHAVVVLRATGPAEPRLERARAIIERQTRHLARMVDDLLDVARVTQGKIGLRSRIVDFTASVQQVVEHGQGEASAKELTLHLQVPSEPAP